MFFIAGAKTDYSTCSAMVKRRTWPPREYVRAMPHNLSLERATATSTDRGGRGSALRMRDFAACRSPGVT